jgi:hypothetical protein
MSVKHTALHAQHKPILKAVVLHFCARAAPAPYCLQDLPGGVPRSIWKWQGSIQRRLFDSVPFYLRESEAAGGCQHCTFVLRYKVIDGQLYTDNKRRWACWDECEKSD